MRSRSSKWLVLMAVILVAPAASAYIGPGAGLSVIGAFWALLVSLGAALLFILMWPFRKALRQRQAQLAEQQEQAPAEGSDEESRR